MAERVPGPGRPDGTPMKVSGRVNNSSSDSFAMGASRLVVSGAVAEEVEGGEGMHLGHRLQLVDEDVLVWTAHVEGGKAVHHSRHALHAVPARVRAAHAHVDGRRR